ncbi:MAG: GTP 3',8-cyclase MoaA [Candidatus Thorarchaeota archaeon]
MSIRNHVTPDSEDYDSKKQSYIDSFGRRIDNLRISVTQKCSFSCFFCHQEGEVNAEDEITAAEIERIVKHASRYGIDNVKLTGGEPLLREDILDIIRLVSPYVSDLSMTTNGLLLEEMASDLKEAGLTRVNVSIHTMDPKTYQMMTGSGDLERVKRGVRQAVAVGLSPIKLNMTVLRGYNEGSIEGLMDFASEVGAVLQIIELQLIVDDDSTNLENLWVDLGPLEESLRERAVKTERRSMQSRYQYTIDLDSQRSVVVEIVRPNHNSAFCDGCTRLRVTSDGRLKPCLYRLDNVVERSSEGELTIEQAFEQAIAKREPYWRDKADGD